MSDKSDKQNKLPENFKFLGKLKLKDKEQRSTATIKVEKGMKNIFIQKVQGVNNTIAVFAEYE